LAPPTHAGRKPRPGFQAYDLTMLGFNDGDPYRVKSAEVEGLIEDSEFVVFEPQGTDWMTRSRKGQFIAAGEIAARFPERNPADLFRVYRFDADGDRVPEFLVVGSGRLAELGVRVAPTLLALSGGRFKTLWYAADLTGDRFRVADVRDLNGDLDPEVVLVGEGGQSGAYQFMAILAHGPKAFEAYVVQNVDSLHFVDLDRDGNIEIVHRERVGRKGAAHQWTYIDKLLRWNGQSFESALSAFPRYHDEQTLPSLVGDLIDNYDARMSILEEKVDAIHLIRGETQVGRVLPKRFHQKKVQALAYLQKLQLKQARVGLDNLHAAWPFDLQVELALSSVHHTDSAWLKSLEASTRAVTLDARSRDAWYRMAAALAALQERSSSVACLVLSAVLGGEIQEGRAFLKARRGEPGMDSALQAAIDEALAELKSAR